MMHGRLWVTRVGAGAASTPSSRKVTCNHFFPLLATTKTHVGTEFIPPPQELVDEFNITWDAAAYGKGPLKLGFADFQYPDIKSYWAAFDGQGARRLTDGNNGDNAGTSWYPNTMNPETGERTHARLAYYDTVANRSNLYTLLETVANELVFDTNSSKRLVARGVKVTDKKTGQTKTVYAKREVVLAAGAVNTPKLLQ